MTAALACVIVWLAQRQGLSRKATEPLLAKVLWSTDAARRHIADFKKYHMDDGGVPASEKWRGILARRLMAFPALVDAEVDIRQGPMNPVTRMALVARVNPDLVARCGTRTAGQQTAADGQPATSGADQLTPEEAALELARREALAWSLWQGKPERLCARFDEALPRVAGGELTQEELTEVLVEHVPIMPAIKERAGEFVQ